MVQSGSSSSVTILKASNTNHRESNGVTHRIIANSVDASLLTNGNVKQSNGVTTTSNGYITTTTTTTTTTPPPKDGCWSDGTKRLLQSYQRVIFTFLFLGYACYTYNRKSVSYVTPTLLATGLISTNSVGVISSCQNMSYAVSKFLGGVLSDKISARILFSFGLLLSGASTVLFSTTENPLLWAALWAVNGFAQGCGWPSCAKLLKKWFSPSNFGTWWSVLTASSNVSGSLSPFLAAYVIINYGWTVSLVVAGFLSIGMGILTFLTLVDDPAQVDLPSPAAQPTPLSNGTTKKESREGEKEGMKDLVMSPFLWIVCVCYLCVFMTKTAVSEWGQLYVMNELGRTQMEASSFTSAMETGGFCGGILAGILTDRIANKVKVGGNIRLLVAAVFMCVCALGLHVLSSHLTNASSQLAVSCVGAVLGGSMFGPISIYGIVASESFPAHLSGTAHAIVALAANVGAVLAGWPLSRVARAWSWPGVMVLLLGLCASSAVLIVATTGLHIKRKAKSE